MKRLLLIITLIIFMTGCTNSKDPPENNIDPEISVTVKQFLQYSSQSNWNKALGLLSGEALINAKDNIKAIHTRFNLLATSVNIKAYDKNGTYARALADVTIRSGAGIDRQFYEFELVKLGKWKIFSQKEISPDLNGRLSEQNVPAKVEQAVKKYITLVAEGQWQNTNQYLSGQALRFASLNSRNVKTGLTAGNLKVSTIGCQNNVWLLQVSYRIKDKDFLIIMKVLDLDQPKIIEINLASVKGGN